MELARARAICSTCDGAARCAWAGPSSAASRTASGVASCSSTGVVVPDKRGRGRPPKVPRPRLVVDEITGVPIVA